MMRELSVCSGVRLGVITNGASKFQWKKYRTLGLDAYIAENMVLVSGDLGISKPEPGIFRAGEERMGLNPEDLWMVGDSVKHDIRGAKACGWHTLWLRRNEKPAGGAEVNLRGHRKAFQIVTSPHRYAGAHRVGPTGELCEHAQGIRFVMRLAQALVVQKDHGVGRDDDVIRRGQQRGGVRLFARDQRYGLLGGKTRGIAFIRIGNNNRKMFDPHAPQQFLAARGLRSKDDIRHKNPLK